MTELEEELEKNSRINQKKEIHNNNKNDKKMKITCF